MTKDFKILEHYLIPTTLFMLNFAVVHFIYLIFTHQTLSLVTFLVLASLLAGIVGILKKNKQLLFSSTLLYLVLLFSVL